MISFEDAYRIALESVRTLGTERLPFTDAMDRILAQDVTADMPMPPFDKAMVDGYACRRADLAGPLDIVETIAAGYEPKRRLEAGQCAKIMTGAMVPAGADCVFMVEHSEAVANGSVRFTGTETVDNIAKLGRDFRKGDRLLERGHRIGPADIAVLAAVGCVRPEVSLRSRVSVISTGDELVAPENAPSPWQIRNSNAFQVCAQAARMGCIATNHGVAQDNEASLDERLKFALAECDVLIMSGGVSMGDFDLVPGALRRRGFEIRYDRVAIQPGKPTTFAQSATQWCFGLPGNPVSSFVIFELLAKPFLFALMGHEFRPPNLRMPLAKTISRKSGSRQSWIPVTANRDGTIDRVEYFGSSHINALSNADGLIAFPQGETELATGTLMDVRLIRN